MSSDAVLDRMEAALAARATAHYDLTLFVSGASSSSARAIRNVRVVCETYLSGRYTLAVVDVNQHPELTRGMRVLATPTLLKTHPAPERRLVGDLSDTARVLAALDLGAPDPARSTLVR